MNDAEYKNSLEYLFGLQMVGIKLGLDNIRHLLHSIGDPQNSYPSVHIAGTNGKGSTAAFLASILREAGCKVGLYTSPHLVDFSERIRINGIPIPENYVAAFTQRVRPLIDERQMTFFEATTAMAFQYFSDSVVDIAVVETGLGGRLDATNIIQPVISIITSIDIEHSEYLGNTIEEIAYEKGGIIKPGIDVLTAVQQPEALAVLESLSTKRNAKLHRIPAPDSSHVCRDFDRMTASIHFNGKSKDLELELIGAYQVQNAQLAVTTAERLSEIMDIPVSDEAVASGLGNVRTNTGISGRLLRVSKDPEIIVDVAHNPAAVDALIENWLELRKADVTHLVLGLMGSKDSRAVFDHLSRFNWKSITIVEASVPGAMPVRELLDIAKSAGLEATGTTDIIAAAETLVPVLTELESVLIFGSHYVVGEYLAGIKEP